jgi:protoporphyrinogen/coproporphyrinogen III oxidase
VLSGIAARTARHSGPPASVADYFRRAYGISLAEDVAIPLVEAWSGASADTLAPSVASEKLQNGVARSVGLKLASRVSGRAVANGYSHEMPENRFVWHVYPEGGVGTLVQQLAAGLDDAIQLESPVEAIVVEAGRVVAVRVRGREEEVSAAISTAPCNVLPRLVNGSDKLRQLERFRFRPMIFVNLRLRGRGLLPDTVLWTPERQFPFFRLTDTTRSMPWLAPPGKSLVTVDLGCQTQDPLWTMAEDALADLCLEHLAPIIRDVRKRFLGARVLRTPIAYPVFLNEYEEARRQLAHSTGIAGLYSVGRNGEFAHVLMEDVYWRTLAKVREIVRDLPSAA